MTTSRSRTMLVFDEFVSRKETEISESMKLYRVVVAIAEKRDDEGKVERPFF